MADAEVEDMLSKVAANLGAVRAEATAQMNGEAAAVGGKIDKAYAKIDEEDRDGFWTKAGRAFLYSFLVGLFTMVLPLAILGTLVTAKVMLIIGFILLGFGVIVTAFGRVRTLWSSGADWKVWLRYAVFFFVFGVWDALGVVSIVEGLLGRDLVTFRELSEDEAAERFGSGLAGVALILVSVGLGRVLPKGPTSPRGPSAPRSSGPLPPEVPPPEVKPSEVPPPEVKPSEVSPPEVKPSETEPPRVEPAVGDNYADFGQRHNLKPELVERMRLRQADLTSTERLIQRGVDPTDASTLAANHGDGAVDLAHALIDRGVEPAKARATANNAGRAGLAEDVRTLTEHGVDPATLDNRLIQIRQGKTGNAQAIRDAAGRVREGHDVGLELGADVVDHTTREAVQHKEVTGTSQRALGNNIDSAGEQLAGAHEQPPPGYERVADVRLVEPKNPLYMADRSTLAGLLKGRKSLSHTDVVRITNGRGTFTFRGPNFD
jgi:hypothetical protein